MLRRIFCAAFLAATASVTCVAAPQTLDNLEPLPINGMVAAVKNEKLAFVSDNGRFVFRGSLYDTWSQKEISSLEDAKHAFKYIDIKKIKFKVDDLSPFTFGKGDKQIIVFTDPQCPSCASLLADMKKVNGYTFKIVELSALGAESSEIVRAMHCAKDKTQAYEMAVGIQKAKVIDSQGADCDTSAIGKRIITAQMFGLKGVPFLIRDDGLVRQGYAKNSLESWLVGGVQ
ncbi:DsbC family protein [Pseudomonas sp. LS-2]|uniref:DsbC family protein n=1 Tax=Pseudomonas sp. LS-2 TaxID=2315859 RepID=UPI000E753C9C|nr:DsbC family protein [Pseudomonas sp. LS-2]RJX72629.1 DsbC family protein [Pseudomonas sp. LS-2]